jgi:hypothetical protein
MGARYAALVEYVGGFDASARARLAELYAASSPDPGAIARAWCEHPERVTGVLDARVRSASARSLLADLLVNHDEPLELRWRDRRAARTLQAVGLANAQPGPGRRELCTLPGALAAVLATTLSPEDVRPSIVATCARWPDERLAALAAAHGVPQMGRVPTVLALSDAFTQRAAVDRILDGVPDPEWMGTALMALELGGMCYWQDLFGDEGSGGAQSNVVPLMRRDELQIERDIADELQRWGLLLRVPGAEPAQELAAVPEELWVPLWELGRDWITEWAAAGWDVLREGAVSRRDGAPSGERSLAGHMKWLACEIAGGGVRRTDDGLVTELVERRLLETSSLDVGVIHGALEVGLELGVWHVDRSAWALDEGELATLDATRADFARAILSRWCVGEVGARADLAAMRALGVDERWAKQVRALHHGRREWFPAWMEQEGLDSMYTGTGYLRPLERVDEETVREEFAYVVSYALSAKLLWLDLLAMLDTGHWHLEGALRELFQLVCAATLFQLTSAVLDRSGAALFLPVQRSSFLTDPQHTAAFDEWIRGWIDGLAVPLGIAARSDDGERVWLDTRALRVESPEGIPDDLRVEQVRLVLQDAELEVDIPRRAGNGWRPRLAAAPAEASDRLPVGADAAELVARARVERVVSYDGKHVVFGPR